MAGSHSSCCALVPCRNSACATIDSLVLWAWAGAPEFAISVMKAICSLGAAALAAEFLRPADADPAVAAHQLGEFVVVAAVLERLAQVRGLLLRRPMLGEPVAHLLAEGVGGGSHVVRGKGGHAAGPSTKSASVGACARHAAEPREIGMHAPEMPRRLVLLGVADGAERPVRLDRHRAECRTGEGERRGREHTPVRVVVVARLGGGFEREPRAVQADQAIGQLVLDRLELADQLAELFSDLGVVHGQLERALRRAERPAGAGEPRHQRDVGEAFGGHVQPRGRRVLKRQLRERRHGEARRDLYLQSRCVACDHRHARGCAGEDKKVRRGLGAFDERRSCPTACRRACRPGPRPRRHRRRRAPAQPLPCPDADLRACARMAFDCWLASARLAPTAPSSGAGQEARPSSSNTSRISRSPASAGSAPSAARPWPARSRHNAAMASALPDRSTAWSGGQRFNRSSRTESRSKPRSASDTPSV